MKTGIIIPCYNEEKRIKSEAFLRFIKENDDYHLCFVNDGSKDRTMAVLQELKSELPHAISIVDVKKNVGKAAAVRAGARFLYHQPHIAHIGFMDADLSTDFADFKELVNRLKDNEQTYVVFGSRNSGGDGIKRDMFRNLLSRFVKLFILQILRLPIRDTQCGAKVFTKEIVPAVFGNEFISRWLFDVEIFLRLKRYFGRHNVMGHIKEQPLMRWVHVDDSKLGWKDSIQIPVRLMHIWSSYQIQTRFKLIEPSVDLYPEYEIIQVPELSIAA